MALKLVRVDDRLIHGQVVAVWLKAVGADRIIIVDDRTARDPFLTEVLTLAAPPGVPVEVYDLAGGTDVEQVFVLVRSPIMALRLREAGIPFDTLNVGGIGAGPGRKPLYKNISANAEELEAMRALERAGTRVELRIVPDDRGVAFASLDKGT